MIESDVSALVYEGNGSTTTGYPVGFRYLDASHIAVAVKPQGGTETVLTSSQFTLHESGVGAPHVTTVTAYPSTTQVTVFRSLPFTQPATFPNNGPFDATGMERALDRLEMQMQQLWRQVLAGAGGTVLLPSGGSRLFPTATWAQASLRSGVKPDFAGQIGTQLNNLAGDGVESVWIAQTTDPGAWAPAAFDGTAVTRMVVLNDATDRGTRTPEFIGQIAL